MPSFKCTVHNVTITINGTDRVIDMPCPPAPGVPNDYPAAQCALLTASTIQAGVMRRTGPNGSPLAGECVVEELS